MDFIQGKLDGLWIIEPRVFGDNRGFFMETWSRRDFEARGLFYDFVQGNHFCSTEESGAKALRPKNSRLSKASLDAGGFARLPAWEDTLAKMMGKEKSE